MWGDQKKANAPQAYPSLYGQPSAAGQLPQHSSLQQPFQPMSHYPPSMAQQMSQQMTQQMAQGLGPPPPYTPYADNSVSQQQMKYMQQMGYNQYMPNTTTSMSGPSYVPQPHQSSMGAIGGAHHQYPSPYAPNPYANHSLYNPYSPYSSHSLASNHPTMVMPHGFDAGARFDGVARPNIPPPPPGVAPNAAQMAALQGQNVVIGQKKSSFLEGGSSGGYTFW